ncbi:ribonuclease HI family protein [Candidatus Woesebacteria bacterium]|nr:ribonuclease HI family protein [Candidatus Woesebacteria bacterium]
MHLTIHTDGGSLNNPGPAAIGFLIHEGENCLYRHSEAIGLATNNVAEYTALIRALSYVKTHFSGQIQHIAIIADSELMIRQVNGLYKVKHIDIKPLHTQVKFLEMELAVPITYTHVLRDKNAEADALVKKALGR